MEAGGHYPSGNCQRHADPKLNGDNHVLHFLVIVKGVALCPLTKVGGELVRGTAGSASLPHASALPITLCAVFLT